MAYQSFGGARLISKRTRIKICGMTRREDVFQAVHLGVDAIGLVFCSMSPRFVTLEQAKEMLHGLPVLVDVVGVFVNPDALFVKQALNELPIQFLQFHGEESAAFCEQFNRPYIKAIPANTTSSILKADRDYQTASALLLDTPSRENLGGSGVRFDWNLIPKKLTKAMMLAGGLNEANVVDAIETCLPYAVDVSSGVENAPGIKSYDKMSCFVEAVNAVIMRRKHA